MRGESTARPLAAGHTCRLQRGTCGSEMEWAGLWSTKQGAHDDFRAHTDPRSVALYPNMSWKNVELAFSMSDRDAGTPRTSVVKVSLGHNLLAVHQQSSGSIKW